MEFIKRAALQCFCIHLHTFGLDKKVETARYVSGR